jgi:hypothetical protein
LTTTEHTLKVFFFALYYHKGSPKLWRFEREVLESRADSKDFVSDWFVFSQEGPFMARMFATRHMIERNTGSLSV